MSTRETDPSRNEAVKTSGFGRRSFTWRLVSWVLGSVGLLYLGTLLYAHFLSRDMIVRSAEKEAVNVTRAAINDVQEVLRSVEESAELLSHVLGKLALTERELEQIVRGFVFGNDKIYGSAAAYLPGAFRDSMERFSPYYHRGGEAIVFADLADDSYRYWESDSFTAAVESGEPSWSEPYLDEGGGNVRMVTYSVPFFREAGDTPELIGVVTADVALDWLHDLVKSIRVGENGYGIILSRQGHIISHPDEELMRASKTVMEMDDGETAPEAREIVEHMMRGESGFRPFRDRVLGKMTRLTYAPVGHGGWSLAVVYPEDELFAEVDSVLRRQAALLVMGLLVLVAVVVSLSRRLTRPIKALAGSAGQDRHRRSRPRPSDCEVE